jgi:hypothetical protein
MGGLSGGGKDGQLKLQTGNPPRSIPVSQVQVFKRTLGYNEQIFMFFCVLLSVVSSLDY